MPRMNRMSHLLRYAVGDSAVSFAAPIRDPCHSSRCSRVGWSAPDVILLLLKGRCKLRATLLGITEGTRAVSPGTPWKRVRAFFQDVTERKRIEETLAQTEKMVAVGPFSRPRRSTSNQDLDQEVRRGAFREDLFMPPGHRPPHPLQQDDEDRMKQYLRLERGLRSRPVECGGPRHR